MQMRSIFFILLVCFAVSSTAQTLKLMTFNIRLDIASDSLNAWTYRKEKVASQVLYHHPHILGVQEALHNQMTDLKNALPSYKYCGGGRDDGKTKGEYSAIFFDTTRLRLTQTNTFWLSPTPDIPGSKGWDAAITRIVTWAKFRDIKTGKTFYAFNTHFDHMGKEARKQSAKMILDAVKNIAGKYPAVITGDFNSIPSDEPIKIIRDKQDPDHLLDAKEISATLHYGPTGTFNGFNNKEIHDDPIDYIFLKGKEWKVVNHATLSQTWAGRFASDHFAVISELMIQ